MSADARPEALEAAMDLLKSNGYVAYKKATRRRNVIGTEEQKLWLCRWGTMAGLVWARDEEAARLRVRHYVFDRYAGIEQITAARVVVHGEITVRESTSADLIEFEEAGGKVPA